MGNVSKWKESLLERAVSRQHTNLMQVIYGKSTSASTPVSQTQENSEGEESEKDDFFTPKQEGKKVNL